MKNFQVISKWISRMLFGSCSTFLLGFLVTMLVVECSNAKGHQGSVGTKGKNLSSRTEKEPPHINVPEGAISTAYSNYGRKILEGTKHLPGMEPIHISPGKNKPDDQEQFFPEPQNKENDHVDAKAKKDGLMAFIEAADQVATLMRKDYTGANRGRRKPPINNQEPKD